MNFKNFVYAALIIGIVSLRLFLDEKTEVKNIELHKEANAQLSFAFQEETCLPYLAE